MSEARGVLYVVATPIGNLEDVTARALRILREASVIACEDTRQTQKLLNHFGIATRMVSYHEHNERERSAELVQRMHAGESVALVSDAGTPAISDPGYRVVLAAIEQGIQVVPVPGPAALVAALAGSGLPTDSFTFHGFLPAKAGQRQAMLEEIRGSQLTDVFYEAPHRLLETLKDIVEVLGAERPVVVARELTKIHEEFARGTATQVLESFSSREVKGEVVLLVGKATETSAPTAAPTSVAARMRELMSGDALDEKDALKAVARELGISKSEAYREWQRARAGKRS